MRNTKKLPSGDSTMKRPVLADWFTTAVKSIMCVTSRYLPVRHETGLFTFGNADANAPLLVSGDYFHTVRRLFATLSGRNCRLLVVDSAGINVWCAAGVGDFNENKIADALHTYEVEKTIAHRTLVLPQLAAAGVDVERLRELTGFTCRWGPASLDDLPLYLDSGCRVSEAMRQVRFSFVNKLLMATSLFMTWLFFLVGPYLLFEWITATSYVSYALAFSVLLAVGTFMTPFLDWFPGKWPSTQVIYASLPVFAVTTAWTMLVEPMSTSMLVFCLASYCLITFMMCIDMLGSTVEYKTTILWWLRTFDARSLFQPRIKAGCNSCGRCLDVCPKRKYVRHHKQIEVDATRECNECLACVKQCRQKAIVNINDFHKDDIKTIADVRVLRASTARELEQKTQ